MKIALVHDWLVTNAGAEKVLKEFDWHVNARSLMSSPLVDLFNPLKIEMRFLQGKYCKYDILFKNCPFTKVTLLEIIYFLDSRKLIVT